MVGERRGGMKSGAFFAALVGSGIYFFLVDVLLMKLQGLTLFPK